MEQRDDVVLGALWDGFSVSENAFRFKEKCEAVQRRTSHYAISGLNSARLIPAAAAASEIATKSMTPSSIKGNEESRDDLTGRGKWQAGRTKTTHHGGGELVRSRRAP
jgi:hypothetical protein